MRPETGKQRALFEAWYAADRDMRKSAESCGVSERTGYAWADRFQWHARADVLDREAAKRAEREAIAARVKTLREHQQFGQLLRRRATEYFVRHEIEAAADAIRAGKEGISIERTAEGLPSFIAELFSLNEDELTAERERILRRLSADLDRPALGTGEDEPGSEGEWTSEPAGPDDEPAGDEPLLSAPAAAEAAVISEA